ncbi:SigE family RNA polymerase sigma factor [Nocardioidaceae bacterium]|nr:SigE family RNA polymerase sigma factor [Nocardioidaceae bacterium]
MAGCHQRLFNVAYALCGNRQDAEDLLQVTLEKIYSRWSKVDADVDDPYAYARRTLTHAHISERRRARWRRERTGEVPEQPARHDVPEDRLALQQALAKLPPRQRQAVVLRHLEDLSVAETAELMRCGEGTVKRSAYDGLRALRRDLDPSFRNDQEEAR